MMSSVFGDPRSSWLHLANGALSLFLLGFFFYGIAKVPSTENLTSNLANFGSQDMQIWRANIFITIIKVSKYDFLFVYKVYEWNFLGYAYSL